MSTVAEGAALWATEQVGKRYRWAGDGPNDFDCSGLVLAAYRWASQGKIRLPHNAAQQAAETIRPGGLANLKPGDLVFYYSPITHNGIYIGRRAIWHGVRNAHCVVQATNEERGVEIVRLVEYANPVRYGRVTGSERRMP